MPHPFTHHFGRVLDLPPAEAERVLQEIVDWLHRRLNTSAETHVEGLGTFRRTSGELSFTPEPGLSQAVNHRYAGLRPVSASGAPVAPPPPAPEPEAEREHEGETPQAAPPEPDETSPADDLPIPPVSGGAEQEEGTEQLADNERIDEEWQDLEWKDDDTSSDETVAEQLPDEPVNNEQTAPRQDHPEETEHASASSGPEAEAPEEADRDLEEAGPAEPDAEGLPARSSSASEIQRADTEDADETNTLLDGVWTPRTGPADEDHPLGPMPPSIMEDAEFSVVEPSDALEPLSSDPPPISRPEASSDPDEESPDPDEEESPVSTPLAAPPAAASRSPEPPPSRSTRATSPFEATRAPSEPPPAEPHTPGENGRGAPWISIVLGSVLVLGLLGGILWWLLTPPADVAGVFEPAPAESPVAAAPSPDPAMEDPDTAPEAFPEAEPAPAAEEPLPPEGPLRGTGEVDPAQGGYTWVVASETSRAAAERQAERYRTDGYRASVLPATVGGRTVYRVGIGQFESASEAERLRPELPPYAPGDTWRHAL